MISWKRRRRHSYPQWRTIKEGDIVWVNKRLNVEPILLVQRLRHKGTRPGGNVVYWHDGVFLSLVTGKIETRKLSHGMTFGEVTRAPRPSESDDVESDE